MPQNRQHENLHARIQRESRRRLPRERNVAAEIRRKDRRQPVHAEDMDLQPPGLQARQVRRPRRVVVRVHRLLAAAFVFRVGPDVEDSFVLLPRLVDLYGVVAQARHVAAALDLLEPLYHPLAATGRSSVERKWVIRAK